MQKGYFLEFPCQKCASPIEFSIASLSLENNKKQCTQCLKTYHFADENLIRQLNQFIKLCIVLRESHEILGNTFVGVNIGDQHVTIPYKLLLTRLNSILELEIGPKPLKITFRTEPLSDIYPELLKTVK